MENEKLPLSVPYIVHEAVEARHERTVRRLLAIVILLAALLFASNAFWLFEWTRYDYTSEESTVTVDGGAAAV